jgi:hypothetical protein
VKQLHGLRGVRWSFASGGLVLWGSKRAVLGHGRVAQLAHAGCLSCDRQRVVCSQAPRRRRYSRGTQPSPENPSRTIAADAGWTSGYTCAPLK